MTRTKETGTSARLSRARKSGRRAKLPRNPTERAGDLRRVSKILRDYALGFPGATEDFPWGERVAKVSGKVFVFLGLDPVPGGPMGLTVKLPVSREEALDLPFTRPTGYGLGKSGWVSATFGPEDRPPIEILRAWIRESYRAIAPQKLVAEMEGPGSRPLSRRSRSERPG
jgi:predicted DNA-binding protein (MmcQ/YjbR family)